MIAVHFLGFPTGPSHAPVAASLVVGAAPGARVPPVDNPPRPFQRHDRPKTLTKAHSPDIKTHAYAATILS